MTAWFVQLKHRARGRRAFTLLEMLVVIVIICILAGIIFYLTQAAGDYRARAMTVANLQKVRAAIEEFHAQYGEYPPVGNNVLGYDYSQAHPIGYEMPSATGMNHNAYGQIAPISTNVSMSGVVFSFGLMSYLLPRYANHDLGDVWTNWPGLFNINPQWTNANYTPTNPQDQQNDIPFTAKVAPIFDNGIGDGGTIYQTVQKSENANGSPYTNNLCTVYDGWGSELMYQSAPPFQSYDLWSYGPQGTNNPNPALFIHSMPGR